MVKIGLIGVGYWGRNHLRSLKKLQSNGEVDEILVCDTNEIALKEVQKYDGVEIERDWKKVLENDSVDLVSIVTPSPFHYSMAKEFMLKGIDVLVEKPLAMTIEECDELIEISEKTGSGLMVGHIFRFHPGILELKKRIAKGEFGDILNIIIKRQTLTSPRPDMGVLLALGIHEVDLTSFLLGEKKPDFIFADMNYFFGNQEEMALIIQKFGTTTAYSYESWIDPTKGKLRELSLIGSQGSASLNFSIPNRIIIHHSYIEKTKDNSKKRFEVVNGGDFEVTLEYKEPLLEELKHFITESFNSKKYRANAEVGKRAVIMIRKAFESNKKREFVRF
ncbi:MAG: Gfo/Idh/MocA family protein [Candidatus Hodarchaeales archaeon]